MPWWDKKGKANSVVMENAENSVPRGLAVCFSGVCFFICFYLLWLRVYGCSCCCCLLIYVFSYFCSLWDCSIRNWHREGIFRLYTASEETRVRGWPKELGQLNSVNVDPPKRKAVEVTGKIQQAQNRDTLRVNRISQRNQSGITSWSKITALRNSIFWKWFLCPKLAAHLEEKW